MTHCTWDVNHKVIVTNVKFNCDTWALGGGGGYSVRVN